MKHHMMMVLFFTLIFYIELVFGMDNYSDKQESSDEENSIDLTQYTKQELNFCEHCGQKSTNGRLVSSKISNNILCHACYHYEREHKKLISLNERKKPYGKHINILVCEFCQQESNTYNKSKVSGKSLCQACYSYEYNHGNLVPRDERKHHLHKDTTLVCEFCYTESIRYVTGKVSGKSLCKTCYSYESRNGQLVPRDERKKKPHKYILVCEFCQKEAKEFTRGIVSGKSLCKTCYRYESRQNHLVPQNKRKRNPQNYKDNIFVCEFCQRESKRLVKGKLSGKSLCKTCYNYESVHGKLVPRDERKKYLHKDTSFPDE